MYPIERALLSANYRATGLERESKKSYNKQLINSDCSVLNGKFQTYWSILFISPTTTYNKNFARFHNQLLRFTIKQYTGILTEISSKIESWIHYSKMNLISNIKNTRFKNPFSYIVVTIIIIIIDPYHTPGSRRRSPVSSSALGSLLMLWLLPSCSPLFPTLEAWIALSWVRIIKKASSPFGLFAVQSTRTFLKYKHKDGDTDKNFYIALAFEWRCECVLLQIRFSQDVGFRKC